MYEISIWVPTKGWKIVRRTNDMKTAHDFAVSFTPLEVQVKEKKGLKRTWWGGSVMTTDHTMSQPIQSLHLLLTTETAVAN